MESLTAALGKGFGIAARLGHRVFRTAVFNALFLFNEEDLVFGIENDVDLLAVFLIYAPQHVKIARQLVGRVGKGFERTVTLASSLRWVHEECKRKGTRHYDVIVNLPEDAPPPPEGVYPPPGYDKKRVAWLWKNCQNLLKFAFYGEKAISKSTKKWAVDHLKWRVQQAAQGIMDPQDLVKQAKEELGKRKKKGKKEIATAK